jgi:NADH-quinone oxidoreductase subunit L
LYKSESLKSRQIAASLGGIYRAAKRKFYVDELYLFITRKVVVNLVAKPAAWIDKQLIDGTVNRVGSATMYLSNRIRALQSGRIQAYTIYFFGGALAMAVLFIYFIK